MWVKKDNKLVKKFEFNNFIEAFSFLQQVAFIAEKHNHHPELYNVYNKVVLKFCTHDKGNIVTELDHKVTREIDEII